MKGLCGYEGHKDSCCLECHEIKIAEQGRRAKAWNDAFDKYAIHKGDCRIFKMDKCTCGLNSTIDAIRTIEIDILK